VAGIVLNASASQLYFSYFLIRKLEAANSGENRTWGSRDLNPYRFILLTSLLAEGTWWKQQVDLENSVQLAQVTTVQRLQLAAVACSPSAGFIHLLHPFGCSPLNWLGKGKRGVLGGESPCRPMITEISAKPLNYAWLMCMHNEELDIPCILVLCAPQSPSTF
jgi:hypothetical protein